MLKAILFDFDQTLVNSADGFREAEKWLQRELYAALGLGGWEDFIAVYRAIRGRSGEGEPPAAKLGQWRAVCAHFGRPAEEAVLRSWQDGYWERVEAGTQALTGASSVLRELRTRFKLGLLSNASAVGDRALRSQRFPGLLGTFGKVIVCDGASIALKPHPAGFIGMLEALGVAPDEAVHVGDSWETDIVGARGAGILPVWLRHSQIRRRAPDAAPVDAILVDSLAVLRRLQPGDGRAEIEAKLRGTGAPAWTNDRTQP